MTGSGVVLPGEGAGEPAVAPISPADVMDADGIRAFLSGVIRSELALAVSVAEEQHFAAADVGWVPDWIELTPEQQDRAVITALSHLRAITRLGFVLTTDRGAA